MKVLLVILLTLMFIVTITIMILKRKIVKYLRQFNIRNADDLIDALKEKYINLTESDDEYIEFKKKYFNYISFNNSISLISLIKKYLIILS